MAGDYVTKKDLDDALERFAERILREGERNVKRSISEAISESEERTKENQKQYHDENMNRLDDVMGELENIREDNMIGTYQTRELRENVDNHEKRISKLETS